MGDECFFQLEKADGCKKSLTSTINLYIDVFVVFKFSGLHIIQKGMINIKRYTRLYFFLEDNISVIFNSIFQVFSIVPISEYT